MLTGQTRMVLLAGEPGIGKTALLAEVVRYAMAKGTRIGWGTCWDGLSGQGFWPWAQAVRSLLPNGFGPGSAGPGPAGEPGEVFATGDWFAGTELISRSGTSSAMDGTEPAEDGLLRLFDAVATALRGIGAPAVVVLDDLQWADAGSVRLLEFVARQIQAVPLLLLGAYRDVEMDASHPLRHLLTVLPPGADLIPLSGLDASAVGVLLDRLGLAVPESAVAEVHRRTGGNPFFVEQVAQLELSRRFGGVAGGTHPLTSPDTQGREGVQTYAWSGPGVPAAVGEIIARRVARLPQGTASVLGTAAVIGSEFDAALLAGTARMAASETYVLLEPAVQARIIKKTGPGSYSFEHDLFRETLYAQLDPSLRARTHLDAARSLERSTGLLSRPRPAELAFHYGEAWPAGPADKAFEYAVLAARDAAVRLSYDQSVRYWCQAVRFCGSSGLEFGLDLRLEMADTQRMAGQNHSARQAYQAVAEDAAVAGRPEILARAALGLHLLGTVSGEKHTQTLALLEKANTALKATGPSGIAARVLAAMARDVADGPDRDVPRAKLLADAATNTARRCGDSAALAFALFAFHDVLWGPGTAPERLDVAERMAAAAAEADDGDLAFEAGFCRFIALMETGDPLAAAMLDDLSRLAVRLRQPRYRYRVLSRQAALALFHGQFGEAQRLMDEAADLAVEIAEPDGAGVRSTQLLVLGKLRRGAAGFAAAAEEVSSGTLPAELAPMLEAIGHAEAGETAAAAAILRALRPEDQATQFRWRALAWAAFGVEAAAAAGLVEECRARYDYLLPYAQDMVVIGGAVAVLGPVQRYLGLAAATLGRLDDAISHLTKAATMLDELRARPLLAGVRAELAGVLLHRGNLGDLNAARRILGDVAAEAADLGLEAVERQASAALAAVGRLAQEDGPPVFRRGKGRVWTLSYAGSTVQLPDAVGLRDLAVLLAAPGQEVPATVLLAGPDAPFEPVLGADPVLDEKARAAYKARIQELERDIAQAEENYDVGRLERLRDEREAVVAELARAFGLGGRARRLGDPGERARTTVTSRIRYAQRRIEQVHPELGAHLRRSLRTGRSCSYRPGQP